MAYEKLKQQLLANRTGTHAPVTQPLRGTGKLAPGLHHVRVNGVDTTWLDTRGSLELTYYAGVNQWQRQRYWLLTRDKSEINPDFAKVVYALFKDHCNEWFDWLDADRDTALQFLRGLQLLVRVSQSEGYVIDTDSTGHTLVNPVTRRVYAHSFATVADAAEYAVSRNLTKSTLQITEVLSAGHDNNILALHAAQASL